MRVAIQRCFDLRSTERIDHMSEFVERDSVRCLVNDRRQVNDLHGDLFAVVVDCSEFHRPRGIRRHVFRLRDDDAERVSKIVYVLLHTLHRDVYGLHFETPSPLPIWTCSHAGQA